jgi:hypothetical protein
MVSDPYAPAWTAAQPYMRARKGDVHIPVSFGAAEELLAEHPEADRDVVLLAVLLHDVGWAAFDEERIYAEAFGANWHSDVRIAHEKEGARLAEEILRGLAYDEAVVREVVEIIAGHDTRAEPLSRNDELVKDADKLWRFTPVGVAVGCDWFDETPGQYATRVEALLPTLFTAAARRIAERELAAARALLRVDLVDGVPA